MLQTFDTFPTFLKIELLKKLQLAVDTVYPKLAIAI